MENLVFSFGPNCQIYNTPRYWAYPGVPKDISDLLTGGEERKVNDILCAAFGQIQNSYFFSYTGKENPESWHLIWKNLPPKLEAWLNEKIDEKTARDKHTKVVLGLNESFIAWDTSSIRWSNLPPGLEQVIQGWLSPAGWTYGPPRIVTWSGDHLWLAVTEYGQAVWMFDDDDEDLTRILAAPRDWRTLKCFSFHPYRQDIWIMIDSDGDYCGIAPEPTGDFLFAGESICDPENFQKEYAETQAKAAESNGQTGTEGGATTAEAEALAQEEAAWAAVSEHEYQQWRAKCRTCFAMKPGQLKDFPVLPPKARICTLGTCKIRQEAHKDIVCEHDLERVLQCDKDYAATWLKTERYKWHPDKVYILSHPENKDEHKLLTESMFHAFQVLYLKAKEEGVDATSIPTSEWPDEPVEDLRPARFESRAEKRRRAEEARQAQEEADRLKREEEEKKAKQEEERRQRAEAAERRAKEEAELKEREEARLKAEAQRKAAEEEAERQAKEKAKQLAEEQQARKEEESRLRKLEEQRAMLRLQEEELALAEEMAAIAAKRAELRNKMQKQGLDTTDIFDHKSALVDESPKLPQRPDITRTVPPALPPRRSMNQHSNPYTAMVAFKKWDAKCQETFSLTRIAEFPTLPDPAILCHKPDCLHDKKNGKLGVCFHELKWLLSGSKKYEPDWLFEQARRWEPNSLRSRFWPKREDVLASYAFEMHDMIQLLGALELSKQEIR